LGRPHRIAGLVLTVLGIAAFLVGIPLIEIGYGACFISVAVGMILAGVMLIIV
jgi:hypothetical protein